MNTLGKAILGNWTASDTVPESQKLSESSQQRETSSKATNNPQLRITALTVQADSAFPTDAAIRQKQAKANKDPSVPKRRKQFAVEQHFDDCGDDTNVIAQSVALLKVLNNGFEPSNPEALNDIPASCLTESMFTGDLDLEPDDLTESETHEHPFSAILWNPPFQQNPEHEETHSLAFLLQRSFDPAVHSDVCELCGGAGRVCYLMVRRYGRVSGPNWDIKCEFDLLSTSDLSEMWNT